MATDTLFLRLALAFLVGGWVTFVTWATENYGGEPGGFFGGLPSTSAFAFLFIGWIESPVAAVEATTSFPFFMSFTWAFLLVYTFFAKRGFVPGVAAALSVWFFAAVSITLSGPDLSLLVRVCDVLLALSPSAYVT